MASGFFALLDDVATLMDDVAVMGKIAGKKTAGLIGDDLAVNAEKASGFMSARELPVLWEITKGSFLNKLIILPLVFLLSAFVPTAITIILTIGGLYLSFEGAEKIHEFFFSHAKKDNKPQLKKLSKEAVLSMEKGKIKSAILTDFILSVEIVIIALSSIANVDLLTQIITVTIIAILATIGVYGLVALIVRMDEFGAKLISLNEKENSISNKTGRFLITALPIVVKGLSVIGTIALILVSGGIFVHNIPFIHDLLAGLPAILGEVLAGLVIGFLVLLIIKLASKVWKKYN
ncbi:DUF808 domain-containing protein [Psychroflexus salinarum]|uniref:DUF808 domain-containing protein n=1 Tax=Psychroflexus salinarum TaxID=546024 RepID=A0ABW3GVS3_9FLAO